VHNSRPVSIQTQSLALRKRKPQETQALTLASSQSWLKITQQTQAPANRNARSKQWQPWLAACQRKRLRFLRFSFTQRTQRKRLRNLRLNGDRALLPRRLQCAYWSQWTSEASFNTTRRLIRASHTSRTKLGTRSFRVAASQTWNSLSLHLRSPTISSFSRDSSIQIGLKSHLFKCAYTWLYLRELLRTELTYLLILLLCCQRTVGWTCCRFNDRFDRLRRRRWTAATTICVGNRHWRRR